MWNDINRIINRDGASREVKLEGMKILNDLDTPEGKKKARKFIRKHKSNWGGWKG